jgi:hypothetical protein
MAIACALSPLNVKAFSEAYGELRHSVNADRDGEIKLKDLGIEGPGVWHLIADCAGSTHDAIFAESSAKAFSHGSVP